MSAICVIIRKLKNERQNVLQKAWDIKTRVQQQRRLDRLRSLGDDSEGGSQLPPANTSEISVDFPVDGGGGPPPDTPLVP